MIYLEHRKKFADDLLTNIGVSTTEKCRGKKKGKGNSKVQVFSDEESFDREKTKRQEKKGGEHYIVFS